MKIINIYSKGKYPADALSNFAPHAFDFDGVTGIPCMEAFLQSLKFKDESEQQKVLQMSGKEAKNAGTEQGWSRTLFWKGRSIDRFSKEYTELVERAYRAMLQNESFRAALDASRGCLLLHTIGKTLRKNTILTWWEFVGALYRIRKEETKLQLKK